MPLSNKRKKYNSVRILRHLLYALIVIIIFKFGENPLSFSSPYYFDITFFLWRKKTETIV